MDIVLVAQALQTLEELLPSNNFDTVKRLVGEAVIQYNEDKAESRYRDDLKTLGIDMKLDVDQSDYEDIPF